MLKNPVTAKVILFLMVVMPEMKATGNMLEAVMIIIMKIQMIVNICVIKPGETGTVTVVGHPVRPTILVMKVVRLKDGMIPRPAASITVATGRLVIKNGNSSIRVTL